MMFYSTHADCPSGIESGKNFYVIILYPAPAASWVENIGGVDSCNFLTDSREFLTYREHSG